MASSYSYFLQEETFHFIHGNGIYDEQVGRCHTHVSAQRMDAPMIGLCIGSVAVAVAATAEAQPAGMYLLPLALCVAFNLGILLVTRGGVAHAGGRRRA